MMHSAIEQCLQDASLLDHGGLIEDENGTDTTGDVLDAPPTNLLDAMVAVAGVINALVSLCGQLRSSCKTLILSCASAGYSVTGGFRVQTRLVERERSITSSQAFWKEKVGEVMADRFNTMQDMTEIQKEFGRTSYTIRVVNAAPYIARAWPGIRAKTKKDVFTDFAEQLHHHATWGGGATVSKRLATIHRFVVPIIQMHADQHPLLREPSSHQLPILLLHRLKGLYDTITDIVTRLDHDTISRWTNSTVGDLNTLLRNVLTEKPTNDCMDNKPLNP